MKRLPALEGLRGMAAVLVALFHAQFFNAHVHPVPWGGIRVDLFFALSGFVLTMAHATSIESGQLSLGGFLLRRAARIYPLHLVLHVAFAAVYFAHQTSLHQGAQVLANGELFHFILGLFLLQNVGLNPDRTHWNAPSWALSVELIGNVFLFWLLKRLSVTRRVTLCVLATYLVGVFFFNSGRLLGDHFEVELMVVNLGVIRGISGMALGYLAFWIYSGWTTRERASVFWVTAGEFLPLSLLLWLSLAKDRTYLVHMEYLMFWLGIPMLILLLATGRGWCGLLLGKAFGWLGKLSFSIYMCHWTVLYALHWAATEGLLNPRARGLWTSIYGATLLLAALLAHHGVEVPLRNRALRWAERKGWL